LNKSGLEELDDLIERHEAGSGWAFAALESYLSR
jgi:hypothetical protein